MKALIDIPEDQVRALAALCRRRGVSRAALIREAIADLVAADRPTAADAFGLWGDGEDGLAYEDRLRGEW